MCTSRDLNARKTICLKGWYKMVFKEADDDADTGLTHRRVSECGRVEIGVYQVLFGFRVRAGFVGSPCCELDWCCGSDWVWVQVFYSIALGILSKRDVSAECFDEIPCHSQVKPSYLDAEFVNRLMELLPEVKAVVLE